jgi:hypothetical protein
MGIIKFVHMFATNFSLMVKLIHNLLKKDHSFSWTNDVENAFVRIKKEINYALILVKLDFENDFIIYTNATRKKILISSYNVMIRIMRNL